LIILLLGAIGHKIPFGVGLLTSDYIKQQEKEKEKNIKEL
jgi:hypothetical protein